MSNSIRKLTKSNLWNKTTYQDTLQNKKSMTES